MLRKTTVLLSLLGFTAFFAGAQTPTAMLNPPPPAMCGAEYPITPSFAYNETRALGLGVTTTFTYQILSPIAGPVVSETAGAGALSSGATSKTFATPINSGLTVGATNTIRFCVAGNCANYNIFIYPVTDAGYIGGATSTCTGDPTVRVLTLGAAHTGQIVDWEYSTNGGANWTVFTYGATDRNHTDKLYYSGLTTTTYYRAIVQSGYDTTAQAALFGACDREYSSVAIVTVNPYPTAPILTSNTPVCSGNTISLSANSPASGATYNWTGPGGYTSSFQNPTIPSSTTAMSGNYSCTVTTTGCVGPAATTFVQVNQTPPAPTIGSNTPVCTGNNVNLLANSGMGGTFTWLGPNSFNSTQTNPTIVAATIAAAGSYSATNTVAGCTGPAATTSVVMTQTPNAPIASSNSPVCEGDPLTVSSTTIPSATYTWSGPAGAGVLPATQNLSFPTSTVGHSGTYSVFATNSGCSSPSTSTNVTVNALPSPPTTSSNSPVCSGNTLQLTSNAIPGATYNWNGPNGFASTNQNPAIPGVSALAAGTYTTDITNTLTGCTSPAASISVSVTATPATPVAGSNTPVCNGGTIALTASTIAGATYSWTGPNGFTSTSQNPTLTAIPAATGTYTVVATVGICQSASVSTYVIVSNNPDAPFASNNGPVCAGTTLQLTATNVSGGVYSWTGPNGFISSSQNPVITPVTMAAAGTYSVTVNTGGCISTPGTTDVVVYANSSSAPVASSNSEICQGNTLQLTASNFSGGSYSWTGPNGFFSGSQNPVIANASLAASGTYSVTVNVGGCVSIPGTTDVLVNPTPAAPVPSSNSAVCSGGTLNLSANNIVGATYSWTGPNSFTANSQNPSIASVTTAGTGTYSVFATVKTCQSLAGTTNVTINPTPAAPMAASNSAICSGDNLNLSASGAPGSTYDWTGPGGYTSTLQNPTITAATPANAGTYFVTATLSGCTSTAGPTSVTINAVPPAPTIGSNSPVCSGSTIYLTSSSVTGATYDWTGPNGFTSTFQNPSISNADPTLNAGIYYVVASVAGCTGPSSNVTVNIVTSPSAPTAGSNSPVCVGSSLNLNASGPAGASYSWTGPNSYSSSLQNPSFVTTSASQSGTYFVSAIVGGCPSPMSTVEVNVYPIPAAPTAASNSPVCSGGLLTLDASPIAGAIYTWSGPNSFASFQQNPTINNIPMTGAGTYNVFVTVNGCQSPSASTTVTVNQTPSAPLAGSNSPLCEGGNLNLTAGTIAGATYHWDGPNSYSSNLQNPTINNVNASQGGSYFVTATVGACTGPAGIAPVSISAAPTAPTAGNNGPVCEGSILQLTANDIVGAVYNWTGPNGFTSSQQNPVLTNVDPTAAGIYSVVATVGGGCTGPAGFTNVTVNAAPNAPVAVSNSPVCSTSDLNFTASIVPGATYAWSGPNAFSSTSQSPTIANATIAATGTYIVQTIAGGCVSDPVLLNVVVNQTPSAPIASGVGTVCQGNTINLNASSIPGATYNWSGPASYSSTDQNPVITGATTTSTGVYNVYASLNGCNGPTNSFSVTVNPATVGGMVSSDATVCEGDNGGTVTLSGHTGTVLNWLASTDAGITWVTLENNTLSQSYANLTQTTMYRVAVQSGVCSSAYSSAVTITVIPQAVGGDITNTNAAPALCYANNEGILTLINYTGTIVQWEVTTDGGVTWDTIANTTDTLSYHNLIENTSYRVLLQGCTTTQYSQAEVLAVSTDACYEGLVIATLVTPNGDNNNDVWIIGNTDDFPPLEVMIANRYGTMIYQNSDYQNNWDCTYNGDLLPDGTYYYVIKVSGTESVYKGNINIMR